MQNFAFHKFPKLQKEEYLDDLIKKIRKIPDFAAISLKNPIQVSNTTFDFNEKINNLFLEEYTAQKVTAKKELNFLFDLPDELISFQNISFADYNSLEELPDIIASKNEDVILEILDVIMPLFLRCDFQIIVQSKTAKALINAINSLQAVKPYSLALKVRGLTYHLKKTISEDASYTFVLKELIKLIQQIYDSEKAGKILPFVTCEMVPFLDSIFQKAFKKDFNVAEKISLITYIPLIFLTLAACYPPALEKINWLEYTKYFQSLDQKQLSILPPYSFAFSFPKSCSPAIFSQNISALMVSCAFLQQVSCEYDRKSCFQAIHAIASTNKIGQMAVLRSLLNISKFGNFKSSFLALKQIFKQPDSLVSQVLIDVYEDNFSEETIQLFKAYELNQIDIYEINIEMKKYFTFIERLGTPDLSFASNNLTIHDRSIDDLLYMNDLEFSQNIQ